MPGCCFQLATRLRLSGRSRGKLPKIESRFGHADRVWVMDRGMASEQNIAWLRAGRRRYVIGACRSDLRRFEQQLVDTKDWRLIREDVQVKLCASRDGNETYILCRSEARIEKDKAIVGKASERLREHLDRLQRRLKSAKAVVDRDRVNQQIGRLLARHTRAAKAWNVSVRDCATYASGLQLIVRENTSWASWAERSAGCYLLRSNVVDWSEEDLWRTYIQLTEAEAAFRIQKSDLSIRPVWHQREDRVRAHIFVCFHGYALWKTLEKWQSHAGSGQKPRAPARRAASGPERRRGPADRRRPRAPRPLRDQADRRTSSAARSSRHRAAASPRRAQGARLRRDVVPTN